MKSNADILFDKKVDFVLSSISSLKKSVSGLEDNLLELILSEYAGKFKTKDGLLLDVTDNYRVMNELDLLFMKFNKNFHSDVLSGFANSLLESAVLSSEYYKELGFKETVIDSIAKTKINLEDKLGFTPKGRLKKNGYLYRLAETVEVRNKVKKYVLDSLTSETPYEEYLRGFRNMIKGTYGKKPQGFNGVLQSYYDQYAYDSFNQLDASTQMQYAKNLNLKHFLYAGSLIETSRKFCQKRAGKVFSVKEAKKWKNDPDLLVSKNFPKSTYKPLIERGRWRCRHFLKFITESLYKQMKKREK